MPYQVKDLAYTAGLIDGEGYIGLVKYIERRRRVFIKNRTTYYYHPTIQIAMTNRKAIDFVDTLFVGNIWFHKRSHLGWKDQWEWSAKGQTRVREVLKVILPYLKIKKKQAELIVSFIEMRESKSPHRTMWGTSSYTREEDEIYDKLRALNKRGV